MRSELRRRLFWAMSALLILFGVATGIFLKTSAVSPFMLCLAAAAALIACRALAEFLSRRTAASLKERLEALVSGEGDRRADLGGWSELEPFAAKLAAQRERMEKDRQELEKASLIRQEFTANVSHELKTPLHAISGYGELLEKGMVRDEDIRPFAGRIRSEAARMTALVEDIINLTKLDGSMSEGEKCDTDLYRIAQQAVASLADTAARARVSLELCGGSAPMRGHPKILYSIIYNLCDNGVKYSAAGGKVAVSVESTVAEVLLKVEDRGCGIPEDSLDRIFERFYRVDKSHFRETEGTGLGLSIVKHGVLVHGGKVDVRSEEGKGSVFTVTLPV